MDYEHKRVIGKLIKADSQHIIVKDLTCDPHTSGRKPFFLAGTKDLPINPADYDKENETQRDLFWNHAKTEGRVLIHPYLYATNRTKVISNDDQTNEAKYDGIPKVQDVMLNDEDYLITVNPPLMLLDNESIVLRQVMIFKCTACYATHNGG